MIKNPKNKDLARVSYLLIYLYKKIEEEITRAELNEAGRNARLAAHRMTGMNIVSFLKSKIGTEEEKKDADKLDPDDMIA